MSGPVRVGAGRRIDPGLMVYIAAEHVYVSGATSLEFELDALLTSMPHPLALVRPDGSTVPGHKAEDFVVLLMGARPTMQAGKLPAALRPLVDYCDRLLLALATVGLASVAIEGAK